MQPPPAAAAPALTLDARQQAVVAEARPHVQVLAGPGSGKTATLAARIARQITNGTPARQIVALTYTRMMRGELRARVLAQAPAGLPCVACGGTGKVSAQGSGMMVGCGVCLGTGQVAPGEPTVGTIHSFAAKVVRDAINGDLAGGSEVLALGWITSADFGIVAPDDLDLLIDAAYQAARKKVKKGDLKAGMHLAGTALGQWPPESAARQELVRRNLLTFDDLLTCLEIVAGAEGKGFGPALREVYPVAYVDEAQDLSRQIWSILRRWRPAQLMTFGDDGQAIFGFMARKRDGAPGRAEVEAQTDALSSGWPSERWPSAMLRLQMSACYRAVPEIVAFNDRLRAALTGAGACLLMGLDVTRAPAATGSAPVQVLVASEVDEGGALTVVDTVTGLLRAGVAPEAIVVLVRFWDLGETIAAALRSLHVPLAMPERGTTALATKQGRAYLGLVAGASRGAVDTVDAVAVMDAFGITGSRSVVDDANSSAIRDGVSLATALDWDSTSVCFPRGFWTAVVCAKTLGDLHTALEAGYKQIGAHLYAPLIAASEAGMEAVGRDGTPMDLTMWRVEASERDVARVKPGHVAISSIHGAKGREWPVVIVAGACEGVMPGPADKNDNDFNESARCLYTATTRARDVLRVVVPTTLRGKPRDPSRWLTTAGLAPANPAVPKADGPKEF